MREPLCAGKQVFLRQLWDIGAVKIETRPGKGFMLKLHEKNPHAPLSPIYVNLRTKENPKPGPLGKAEVYTMAVEMLTLARKKKGALGVPPCTMFAGIPRAGTPFAVAACEYANGVLGETMRRLPMEKQDYTDDARRTVRLHERYAYTGDAPAPRVLVFDDLITKADTKLEAFDALTRGGYVVGGLTVFLDREQGGSKTLRESGVSFTAVVTFSQVLEFYHRSGMLDTAAYTVVQTYLRHGTR